MTNVLPQTLDLKQRSDETEWLDGANIDPVELEQVLRDLASFNGAFLGHYPLIRWLRRAVKASPTAIPLTVVDVGCGYGDLLRAIRRWARPRGVRLNLIGVDLNSETIRIARAATDPADKIDFQVLNIFELGSSMTVDFVISSLVAHHLPDGQIVEFLRLMEMVARRGWLIYDLQRHRFLYHFIGTVGRLARLHPMVVHDGQVSVRRSLTRPEWEKQIAAAGIPRAGVTVHWFLFRFLIGRLR